MQKNLDKSNKDREQRRKERMQERAKNRNSALPKQVQHYLENQEALMREAYTDEQDEEIISTIKAEIFEGIISEDNTLLEDIKNMQYGKAIDESFKRVIIDKPTVAVPIEKIYAAPKLWNFYKPHNDSKKLETIESIKKDGIIHPIILWKIDKNLTEIRSLYGNSEWNYPFIGNDYMILAGHNRSDAQQALYELTHEDKYLYVSAVVFDNNTAISETDKMDAKKARRYIRETNYTQRHLDSTEKKLSVIAKYEEDDGSTFEETAQQLGLSSSSVHRYSQICKLIPDFKEKAHTGEFTLESIIKLASCSEYIQNGLNKKYGSTLSNKHIGCLKKSYKTLDMATNAIDKYINQANNLEKLNKEINYIDVMISNIPEHLEKDFKLMAKKWVIKKIKNAKQ